MVFLHKRSRKKILMMQKININDIAKITGFSTTTVSRVLNGKAEQYRIAKKTQKEIESAAKKMNYTPNLFATNLFELILDW